MINFQLSRDNIAKFFPVFILGCFIAAYWAAFYKMSIRWSGGDNSYSYLIIPLFAYLLWDRRYKLSQGSRLKAQGSRQTEDDDFARQAEQVKLSEKYGFKFGEFSWNIFGLIPVLFSIGLILIGEVGSVETLLYIGLWGCVVGIIFTLYGWRIRYLVFPLIILLFIVPLPPFINRMLTFQLKLAATTVSVIMLRASGVSVFQEGNIIDLGVSQLQVVDACSGMRYLMPLILIALLVGHFYGRKLWRRVILLLLVVPVSIFLNAFRIWITGMLTVKGHEELAQSFFHDFSGWLIFMLATGILVGVAYILRKIGSNKKEKPVIDSGGRQVGVALPAVLTGIICLMFLSSGWALKQIPSARNLPQRSSFKAFPTRIGEWQGKRSYLSKEIMDQLWADDYVSATFSNHNSRNVIHLFIPFYEYQGTRHTAHAPQSCLLGGGWALLSSQERIVQLNPEGPIKIMTMTLEKGNAKILGSYFFFQRGRVITSPWLNKLYLMWDSFAKRRTEGAVVRVELVMAPGQTYEEAWGELEKFIKQLWSILPDYVPL